MRYVDTPLCCLRDAFDRFGVDVLMALSVPAARRIWDGPLLSPAGRLAIDAIAAMHVSCPKDMVAAACDRNGTFHMPDPPLPSGEDVAATVGDAWARYGAPIPDEAVRDAAAAAGGYLEALIADVSAGIRSKSGPILKALDSVKRETARRSKTDRTLVFSRSEDLAILGLADPMRDPDRDVLRAAVEKYRALTGAG